MKKLNIIFRTCAIVKTMGPTIRPFSLDKPTLILKCLKSLLESCKGYEDRISLDIVDDSSGQNFIDKIHKIILPHKLTYQIHRLDVKNNGRSLEYCYNLARNTKGEIIYFCEDDYFHLNKAIPAILDAYDSKVISSSEFAINPMDYPVLYQNLFPTLIFKGKYNYWRSTHMSTATFVIPTKLFKRYIDTFFKLAKFNEISYGGEKETVNRLWLKEIPLISPIPSLTGHMHEGYLSNFVDWEKEISKIKINV